MRRVLLIEKMEAPEQSSPLFQLWGEFPLMQLDVNSCTLREIRSEADVKSCEMGVIGWKID